MQSNGSTDAVTPLGTPNLTQMDDGDAIRHEMAPRGEGGEYMYSYEYVTPA